MITITSISIVTLLVRLLFKSFEMNFGWLESDFLFYISSLSCISLSSFIRKFLELFEFPEINWILIKDFFKSSYSEKLQIIKDIITWFNSPYNNNKMTMGGPDIEIGNKDYINKNNPTFHNS